MYETRISPDGTKVAIRNRPDQINKWSVSNGGYYHDDHVADWTSLAPAVPDEPASHWYREEPVALEYRLIMGRSGDGQHYVGLEVLDGASSTPLLETEFDAEQFVDFMAGRIPGSVQGVLSRVARRPLLERIGKTMNNFSQVLPRGTDEGPLSAWAEETAAMIEIPAGSQITTSVTRIRDGVRVTWRAYGPMSADDCMVTEQRLSAAKDDLLAEV